MFFIYLLYFLCFVKFLIWLTEFALLLRIRNLRDISSLEPAPKVWKPMSVSKNLDFKNFLENRKLVFYDFWLFLRSLSCIGSSGRLVGRISPKFRPNPSPWRAI